MKYIDELRANLEEDEDWGVYDGVLSRTDVINLLKDISALENTIKELKL